MRLLSRVGTLALLALLGTLLVFFFPAHCGAFSVTNGPATAFRALTAARQIFAAINAALLVAAARMTILYLRCTMVVATHKSSDTALFALRC